MQKTKKWIRRIGIFCVLLFILSVIAYILLQTNPVQNFLTKKAISALSRSLGTDIEIGKVKFDYFDHASIDGFVLYDQSDDTLVSGSGVEIDIGFFSIFGKKINIDKISMNEGFVNLYAINDSIYNFTFLTASADPDNVPSKTEKSWAFSLDEFDLRNIKFHFKDKTQEIFVLQKSLDGRFKDFNLTTNKYILSDLSLTNGNITYNQNQRDSTSSDTPFSLPSLPITLGLGTFLLNDQDIAMILNGESYNISNFNSLIENFNWTEKNLQVDVKESQFLVGDDFVVSNVSGQARADSSKLIVTDLDFQSSDNFIAGSEIIISPFFDRFTASDFKSVLTYPMLQRLKPYLPSDLKLLPETELSSSVDEIGFNRDAITGKGVQVKYGASNLEGDFYIPYPFDNSRDLFADVKKLTLNLDQVKRIYIPLKLPDLLKESKELKFNGVVDGNADKIEFKESKVQLDNQLTADFTGYIQGVTMPDSLYYNLNLSDFTVDSSFISQFEMAALSMHKLGDLRYKGTISGNLNSIRLDGITTSDLGTLGLNTNLIYPSEAEDFQYDGQFSLDSFDLGTLINDPDIGRLTLETKLAGSGFDPNNLTSNLSAKVSSVDYRGYSYKNIEVNGDVSDCVISGRMVIRDQNAQLDFDGMISFEQKPYVIDFKSHVDTINFSALNLPVPDFGVSGDFIANFTLPISQDEAGKIMLIDFSANDLVNTFREDSLVINLYKELNQSHIDFTSSFLKAEISGEFRILELPSAFANLYNFYAMGDTILLDSIFDPSNSSNLRLMADLNSLDFLQFYFPSTAIDLKRAGFDFIFDFKQHRVNGALDADSLVYDNIYIEKAHLDSRSQGQGIDFQFIADNFNYANINLPLVSLSNYLDSEELTSDILIADEDRIPKFKVGTKLFGIDDGLQLKLNDSLVLNNSEWFIRENNEILITDHKLLVKNLVIYDKDEQMSISSMDSTGNDLSIVFENFNVSQFISLLSSEKSNVSGRINGNVELKDLKEDLYFLANLTLNEIVYRQKPVGSIKITADENPRSGIISGTFDLIGSRNDILGRGSFDPNTRAINWDIFAGLLEMRLLDPFLEEFITNSEGVIFGEAHIGGTIDRPLASGEIILEDIATTVDVNNTRYNFENHLLNFDNQKIDIGSVEIFDQLGNSAQVSGRIYHNYYSDLILDFQVETDKFLFLNTTKENNPIFYGKVLLDATIDITGPPDLLDVQMFAKSLDETSINLSPFSETESILKEEFIRYGKPGDFDDLTSQYLQKLGREYPFDVYLTLEANDESEFTFVVDPLSGDKLNCHGNGNLQINLDPYGEQEIYGKYTVTDGTYSFSYGDFINKRFKLTPGGSINFNGNPFNAILDVKAVYTANTTTYELIKNEVSLSEGEIQSAQRRTKVNVILSLTGSLMEPEITLDLEIPDLQSGTLIASIDRKLNELRNNQDELNNQVFGLLVFNSFLLSESASTDFNSVSQDIALSSISNLISSQLNNLAQNVLRGVDVSIDVNSYNSQYLNEGAGGNITEVGLNVSKQLFNDRVRISAGGNINFDNSINNQNQFSTFIGDFVVEYKLNEQGNYRIRVFSRSNYDQLLNQNTSRTGVSLFFSKEFDSKIDEK